MRRCEWIGSAHAGNWRHAVRTYVDDLCCRRCSGSFQVYFILVPIYFLSFKTFKVTALLFINFALMVAALALLTWECHHAPFFVFCLVWSGSSSSFKPSAGSPSSALFTQVQMLNYVIHRIKVRTCREIESFPIIAKLSISANQCCIILYMWVFKNVNQSGDGQTFGVHQVSCDQGCMCGKF